MNSQLLSTLILVIHWLIIIGLSLRIIIRRPPVGVSLAWLAVIFSVPLLGAGVYLLFGEKRLGKARRAFIRASHPIFRDWQQKLKQTYPVAENLMKSQSEPLKKHVENVLGFPVLPGNVITLLSGYAEIFDNLVADIENASSSVHLGFYIWFEGGRTDDVVKALIVAAGRGVDCRALADAVGSKAFLRSRSAKQLRAAGVKLVTALPTGGLRTLVARTDLRNHRKIVVIDDQIAYTGSQNLVDPRLFKKDSGVGEWVDAMVRITGPAATSLDGVFRLDWAIESESEFDPPPPRESLPVNSAVGMMQIVPSGPDLQPEAIHQLLVAAIYAARNELVMTTPYFVPDDAILTALVTAALRGVNVTLVVPARNDSVMVRYASASHYDVLMNAGVRIALFRDGLLHTKSLTIDGEVSIFGSVNFDIRSLWLNFEISLIIYDEDFTRRLQVLQHTYLGNSELLDRTEWQQRPAWRRIVENSLRLASPLL